MNSTLNVAINFSLLLYAAEVRFERNVKYWLGIMNIFTKIILCIDKELWIDNGLGLKNRHGQSISYSFFTSKTSSTSFQYMCRRIKREYNFAVSGIACVGIIYFA